MVQPHQTSCLTLAILLHAVALGTAAEAPANGFYKEPQLFSTAPSETKSVTTIGRCGSVGRH